MSACAAALAAPVAAASMLQSGVAVANQRGPSTLIQTCPSSPSLRPSAAVRKALDDKVICSVMCCCADAPAIGSDGCDLKQVCASEVFAAADKLLGNKSRYKSELSWNMLADPVPEPFMHRDASGANTTEPSRYWQGRAWDVEGYVPGKGLVRRPDLTLVDDPCVPPSQRNVERIVELKFGADRRDREQDQAYAQIAGDPGKYQVMRSGGKLQRGETACSCPENRQPQPVPSIVPAPFKVPDWAKAVGWTALTVLGAAATVVAVLTPFDGPLGDIAAGSATAVAAARAAALWSAVSAASN